MRRGRNMINLIWDAAPPFAELVMSSHAMRVGFVRARNQRRNQVERRDLVATVLIVLRPNRWFGRPIGTVAPTGRVAT